MGWREKEKGTAPPSFSLHPQPPPRRGNAVLWALPPTTATTRHQIAAISITQPDAIVPLSLVTRLPKKTAIRSGNAEQVMSEACPCICMNLALRYPQRHLKGAIWGTL